MDFISLRRRKFLKVGNLNQCDEKPYFTSFQVLKIGNPVF